MVLSQLKKPSKSHCTSFNKLGKLSPISRQKFVGEIEFKNMSYQFEESSQPVIKNLSFKIPAGQKVAIVGKWDPESRQSHALLLVS